MKNLLSTLIELTTMGSIVIVFVIIARVLLKKAPKIYSYALWSVVLFRLLCPFSFESAISPLPSSEAIISLNQTSVAQQVNLQAFELPLHLEHSVNSGVTVQEYIVIPIEFILGIIWIVGIAVMLLYSVVALIKTKKSLVGCIQLKGNIYLADNIKTPFVLGWLNPKIYLPSSINDSEIDFIIKHEQTHIKRLDHITRILAFVALCVHWFNPLVWIAYTLSAKDMEMSCDEAVMNKLGASIKKEYASSLLRFEVQKHLISPLAFSEGDTKGRVKNIMKHKKTKVWVSDICVVVVCVTAFMLLTNSKEDLTKTDTEFMLWGEIIVLDNGQVNLFAEEKKTTYALGLPVDSDYNFPEDLKTGDKAIVYYDGQTLATEMPIINVLEIQIIETGTNQILAFSVTGETNKVFYIPNELYEELMFNINISSAFLTTNMLFTDIENCFHITGRLSSGLGDVMLFIDEDGNPMALKEAELGPTLTPVSIEIYKKIENISFVSEVSTTLIAGYINIKDNEVLIDTVQIITSEDEELIAELELDIEQDMPSGYYIHNETNKVDTLKLTDETKFIFTDFELKYIDENLENRLYETTSVDEFINGSSYQEVDLENLEDRHYIPYFIEIQNGVDVKHRRF